MERRILNRENIQKKVRSQEESGTEEKGTRNAEVAWVHHFLKIAACLNR
jgi:hypothetical protein